MQPNERNIVIRTHDAGALRAEHAGNQVVLAGWVAKRRDHGGLAFIDLRDASGRVQVVIRDELLAATGAHDLRNEYCIKVTGVVEVRPEGNENPDLATGQIDLQMPEALAAEFGHSDFGIYAEVVTGGEIALGDEVRA